MRIKYRVGSRGDNNSDSIWSDRLQLAAGYDLRLPTGATARLSLDCSQPPCSGNHQAVPDVGLGKTTHKWSIFASSVLGRVSPHGNVSYVLVPTYACSRRFGSGGRCRGAVFEMDRINAIQDAKGQDLSNEWNVTGGFDYQMQPFRSTLSVDVIGRRLIRAGQFYEGPARMVIRDSGTNPSDSVSTRIESRHGNINTVVGVIGAKVGFKQRWVLAANVLFPLNSAGLQPNATWVLGLERALTH